MKRHLGYLLNSLAISLFLLICFSPDAFAAQVQLAWNQSTDPSVIGYKVYYGTQSNNYPSVIDAGANLGYTVTGLSASQAYYFAVTAYTSDAESGFSQQLPCYFVTAATPANGQITPTGSTASSSGGSQTFSIVPSAGYQISGVLIDGVSVGVVSQYTFSDLNACHTITANFTSLATDYTISASAQGSGSISPSGTVSVVSGAKQSFTIAPAANYKISEVTVDGKSIGAVSSHTFTNVTANHTIVATFVPITYTISATMLGSGSISPSGTVSVISGANQSFTISPAANYKISGVKVDGKSIGAVSSYTFTDVSAHHTIAVTFALIKYRMSASLEGAGSISPSGTLSVASGANLVFRITPAVHYRLTDLLVDGISTGTVSNGVTAEKASTYTFTDVAADHTFKAIFSEIPPPVADAGPDQDVESGSIVTLSGSNSTDTVSGIASYRWTQVSGPLVKLSSHSDQICTFTAPNVASGKLLTFNLEVTNTGGIVNSASCLVNVSGTDKAPSANAGANQIVIPYTNVALDGSGSSDPDDEIASYSWIQISGPHVAILHANTAHASFVAPDTGPLGASLVFQLRVTDHFGLASRDQCTVNVVNVDQPPFADAGQDQTAVTMSSVTLNGSGSSDPVNSTDSYRWKQISGVPVTLSDPTAQSPVFTAPAYSDAQSADLLFMLTVTDANDQLSATAKCAVTVTPY